MRISIVDSPRYIGSIRPGARVTVQVVSGTLAISDDEQTLRAGQGFTINSATVPGIQQFVWYGQLWMMGTGGACVAEVVLPC